MEQKNPFDQFDTPQAVNPFDQFDSQPAVAEPKQSAIAGFFNPDNWTKPIAYGHYQSNYNSALNDLASAVQDKIANPTGQVETVRLPVPFNVVAPITTVPNAADNQIQAAVQNIKDAQAEMARNEIQDPNFGQKLLQGVEPLAKFVAPAVGVGFLTGGASVPVQLGAQGILNAGMMGAEGYKNAQANALIEYAHKNNLDLANPADIQKAMSDLEFVAKRQDQASKTALIDAGIGGGLSFIPGPVQNAVKAKLGDSLAAKIAAGSAGVGSAVGIGTVQAGANNYVADRPITENMAEGGALMAAQDLLMRGGHALVGKAFTRKVDQSTKQAPNVKPTNNTIDALDTAAKAQEPAPVVTPEATKPAPVAEQPKPVVEQVVPPAPERPDPNLTTGADMWKWIDANRLWEAQYGKTHNRDGSSKLDQPKAPAVQPESKPAPVADVAPAPAPVVEAPKPAVEAPAPIVEQPAPVVETPKPVEPARSVQTEMPGVEDSFNITGEQVATPKEVVTDNTPDMLPDASEPAYVGQARTQLAKLESAGQGESPQAKTLRETIEASKPKPVETTVEPVKSEAFKEPQGVQEARAALARMEASGNGQSKQADLRRAYIRKWELANGREPSFPEPVQQESQKPVEPEKPVKVKKSKVNSDEPIEVQRSRSIVDENKKVGRNRFSKALDTIEQYEEDMKLKRYDKDINMEKASDEAIEEFLDAHEKRKDQATEFENEYAGGVAEYYSNRQMRNATAGDLKADIRGIATSTKVPPAKLPSIPKWYRYTDGRGVRRDLDHGRVFADILKPEVPEAFAPPPSLRKIVSKFEIADPEFRRKVDREIEGMVERVCEGLTSRGWTQLDPSNHSTYDALADLLSKVSQGKDVYPQEGVNGVSFSNKRLYNLKANEAAFEPPNVSPDSEIATNWTKEVYANKNNRLDYLQRQDAETVQSLIGDVSKIPAEIIDRNNFPVPEYYVKEGDNYVFKAPEQIGDNPFSRRDPSLRDEAGRTKVQIIAEANKLFNSIPEESGIKVFDSPIRENIIEDTNAFENVADIKEYLSDIADNVEKQSPEIAAKIRQIVDPVKTEPANRNPKIDATKAEKLDERIATNAENRKADSEARRGYQGIIDRAVFEARKTGKVSEKEIQGLTNVLNYVGSRFFKDVKLSIRGGERTMQGQYDASNRIVTIFKEAITNGRFEDTAAHEIAHHLSRFLPESDRVALRNEWQAARDKYLKENPGFAKLVGDKTADWGNVRVNGHDLQAMAKIHPELLTKEYFSQIPQPAGYKGDPMYKIRATDESYRLFNANEWFAETFKEVARERLKADPAYSGNVHTWKDKLVGLWNNIKTNFRQIFGKDNAQRILSNFAKGRYEAKEQGSNDIHSSAKETFNSERDSIDNPDVAKTEIEKGEKPQVSVGGKVYRSITDAAPVKFFKSIGMRMRKVASNNPQSEAVKQIVNDFALTPGTKGDAVKTDYNTDVSRQREVFTNRLSLALGPILKDIKTMSPEERKRFNDLFVRAIEGRLPRDVGGEVGKSVKAVKDILAEMHQYGIDAGLDIGKVSEYFPRATNYDAVVADPEGFVNAASKAYEMKWNREQAEAETTALLPLPSLEKPDFKEQARAWRDAIILGEEGIDFEAGIFDRKKASNSADFQKERVFTPEEAEQFDAFREKDIATLLSRYTGSLVRRAEVARRLGAKGEGWADAKKRMYEEGVSADDIQELEKALKSNLGVTSIQLNPSQQAWMDANNVVVTAAYLRMTGLLNLVEPGAIGVRTGGVSDTPRVLAQNLLRVRNVLSRLSPHETKAAQTEIERIYGQGHDIYSALGLEMGLTSVHDGISSPSVGFHGDEGYATSGKLREAVDNLHRLYGIHATEVAKRETALREGARFIDKTLSWANGENGLQKAFGLTGDTALATDRLAELGINKADIPEFSKWVKEMRALEPDEQLKRIMDRNDPMAAKYRNALGVFSKQAVVQATASSKQIASKDTPLGRLFFQLSTYVNEWSSQQGRYLGETSKNIVGKNNYSVSERLMAAGSLGAFAMLSAGYYGLGEIRKNINGYKEKEPKPGEMPTWVRDAADAVMWTGIAGPAEMIWKAIERGQMPAGVLGNIAGQSIKAAKEFAENPDSNAKQKSAAKLAYRLGVVPAVNTGLAAIGGPIPAAAAQVVAGTRTEKAVADAVASDAPAKGKGAGPTPPKPPSQPRPPRPGD